VAGRIVSMKNSSDTIGNQTRSAVPQPTAPPCAPLGLDGRIIFGCILQEQIGSVYAGFM